VNILIHLYVVDCVRTADASKLSLLRGRERVVGMHICIYIYIYIQRYVYIFIHIYLCN